MSQYYYPDAPELGFDLSQLPPCSPEWPCGEGNCPGCYQIFIQQLDAIESGLRREAAETLSRHVASATTNRELLRYKLAMHGDLFMSRWKKRSQEKRAQLLHLAHADLPERRFQDLFTVTQSNHGDGDRQLARTPRMRFRLLLPYLAVDSLKKTPVMLFALLHHRTERSLADWAPFDMNEFRNAWENGLLGTIRSSDCMVAYGPRYGDVVPCDDVLMDRGDIIESTRGQLLLEAQSTLMIFLLRLINETLEGANLDTPSCTKWSLACTQGFHASGDRIHWSSYSNAPFSPPPIFDIDACISIAQLRMNAASDHLALLQTVPTYARRYIRVVQQGVAAQVMGKDSCKFVNGYIGMDIVNMYQWAYVKEEAEHVKRVQSRYIDQIRQGSALPPEYDNALAAFAQVLMSTMFRRTTRLRRESQMRPGFEEHRECSEKLNMSGSEQARCVVPDKFFSDPLYWCMMNLTLGMWDGQDNSTPVKSLDFAPILPYLDDHLEIAPADERARLDQLLVERLSDLAATHEILLSINLSRPRNKFGDMKTFLQTENRLFWKDEFAANGLVGITENPCAALLRKFNETPAPQGRRDKAWLDQFNKVHSSLADYWVALRKVAPYQMADKTLAQLLQADLDPAHLAEVDLHRKSVMDEIAARQATTDPALILRELTMNDCSSTNLSKAQKKNKKKTRPAQTDDDLSTAVVNPPATVMPRGDPVISTTTTKRAAALFKKMYSRDSDAAGQSCDWDQFVHSMQDVGFAACNSTGSAVQFELADKGKIVFHKPHPVPKVDPVMLKAMGKRLGKWFGFGEGTFVQAG